MIEKTSEVQENAVNASKLDFALKSHLTGKELNQLAPVVSEKIDSCQLRCNSITTNLDKLLQCAEKGVKITSDFDDAIKKAEQSLNKISADDQGEKKFDNFEEVQQYLQTLEVCILHREICNVVSYIC